MRLIYDRPNNIKPDWLIELVKTLVQGSINLYIGKSTHIYLEHMARSQQKFSLALPHVSLWSLVQIVNLEWETWNNCLVKKLCLD